jgi:hypothetical protein
MFNCNLQLQCKKLNHIDMDATRPENRMLRALSSEPYEMFPVRIIHPKRPMHLYSSSSQLILLFLYLDGRLRQLVVLL